VIRRVVALLAALVLVGAACSDDGVDRAIEELPPTTLTTTPIEPTGAADTVRRWVEAVAGDDDGAAFAFLAPESQAAVGGPEGYRSARRELREQWGRWATTPSTSFDAVPVDEGVAAVIVHAATEEGGHEADAVVLRVDAVGEDWLVDPLGAIDPHRPVPEPGSTIASEDAELAVVVPTGVELQVYVDGQRAAQQPATPAGDDDDRIAYAPERRLGLGWHVVTFVFRRDAVLAARATTYLVDEV
jgi:hypothetical protein